MVEPMTAAEIAADRQMFAPDFEPRPWVTFDLRRRADDLARRSAAVRAIQDWPGVSLDLLRDSYRESDRIDADYDALDADADLAIARFCSWT